MWKSNKFQYIFNTFLTSSQHECNTEMEQEERGSSAKLA